MTLQVHEHGKDRRQTLGVGLIKGLGVTLKHLFKHNTVIQYPDEKQDLPSRTRGVIALKEENCTVCMLCGRECPDWCIYIDSHKETLAPKREGGRPRKRNVLDRFAIDYALCMYCGICVEVCPYDALFWSREFEYAEYDIRELTHEKEKLSDWMATVLPPPLLEEGAEFPGAPAAAAGPGTAQRPSPPSQATAAEARPEQAERAPEAAATPAPAPGKATPAQQRAGETKPAEDVAVAEPTEQTTDAQAGRPVAETAREVGPEAIEAKAERVPAPAAPSTRAEPRPAEAPVPGGREAGEAAYRQVLEEQLERGASPQVAEARARVARVKAERGLRGATSDGRQAGRVAPEPSGAPEAEAPRPEQGPVAPQPEESAGPAEAPQAEAQAAEAEPASQAEAEAPSQAEAEPTPEERPGPQDRPAPEAAPAEAAEDPDVVYERVLAAERAKGSSDAVAVGRAKAARVRAQKGTRGPKD